jgi:hypothetical protein
MYNRIIICSLYMYWLYKYIYMYTYICICTVGVKRDGFFQAPPYTPKYSQSVYSLISKVLEFVPFDNCGVLASVRTWTFVYVSVCLSICLSVFMYVCINIYIHRYVHTFCIHTYIKHWDVYPVIVAECKNMNINKYLYV